jgi:ATP/maltotriose-dependent transcriptional regulator MalT
MELTGEGIVGHLIGQVPALVLFVYAVLQLIKIFAQQLQDESARGRELLREVSTTHNEAVSSMNKELRANTEAMTKLPEAIRTACRAPR